MAGAIFVAAISQFACILFDYENRSDRTRPARDHWRRVRGLHVLLRLGAVVILLPVPRSGQREGPSHSSIPRMVGMMIAAAPQVTNTDTLVRVPDYRRG
jgi:hypothetical protein